MDEKKVEVVSLVAFCAGKAKGTKEGLSMCRERGIADESLLYAVEAELGAIGTRLDYALGLLMGDEG